MENNENFTYENEMDELMAQQIELMRQYQKALWLKRMKMGKANHLQARSNKRIRPSDY